MNQKTNHPFQFLMQSFEKFASSPHIKEPIQVFRLRSLILVYMLIFALCNFQIINAFSYIGGKTQHMAMILVDIVIFLSLMGAKRVKNIERYSYISLFIMILTGILMDTLAGRNAHTPILIWYSLVTFVGFVLCGKQSGLKIMGCLIFGAICATFLPLIFGSTVKSGDVSWDSYGNRLRIAICMASLISLAIVILYDRFFLIAREEQQRIRSGIEKQRNKILLTQFANTIAEEMHHPLQLMEKYVETLHAFSNTDQSATDAQLIQEARACVATMGETIDRYRLLSIPFQTACYQGISLVDFLHSIQHFCPGSTHKIGSSIAPYQEFRGEFVFSVQLILCLALMRAIGSSSLSFAICLEVEQIEKRMSFRFPIQFDEAAMELHESFFQELREMLVEMHGLITLTPQPNPVSSYEIQITVPLNQLT